MDKDKVNRTIATRILGWKSTKWENRFVDNKGNPVDVRYKFTDELEYAWLVAEKLYISICPQCGSPEDMSVHAEIDNQPLGNYYQSFAETAPMAICKVALKSIGLDISDIA
jgi:hypothetical protein